MGWSRCWTIEHWLVPKPNPLVVSRVTPSKRPLLQTHKDIQHDLHFRWTNLHPWVRSAWIRRNQTTKDSAHAECFDVSYANRFPLCALRAALQGEDEWAPCRQLAHASMHKTIRCNTADRNCFSYDRPPKAVKDGWVTASCCNQSFLVGTYTVSV